MIYEAPVCGSVQDDVPCIVRERGVRVHLSARNFAHSGCTLFSDESVDVSLESDDPQTGSCDTSEDI